MKGGNACWKQEKDMTINLFGEYEQGSKFTIRNHIDYKNYQFKNDNIKSNLRWADLKSNGNRYNTRSNIPLDLVKDILKRCEQYVEG